MNNKFIKKAVRSSPHQIIEVFSVQRKYKQVSNLKLSIVIFPFIPLIPR